MVHMPSPTVFVPGDAETSLEAPFNLGDLLYTRTDTRGVILAANENFPNISGYGWSDLIGAPHRLVRHPDMPKGFFHLFWNLLKNGDPAVGYVKNRTKDGRYYWVFAVASPCDGGYFSVRMKPSSAFFTTIRAEYARHLKLENDENLTAEASGLALLARFRSLGFASYTEVMSHAFTEETRARDAALGNEADREGAHLSGLVTSLVQAVSEQTRLVSLFANLKLLPVNMRLVASRLEPQGGPISQISMNYKTASDEIATRLSTFVTGSSNLCGKMADAVRMSLILSRSARLQAELARNFKRTKHSNYDNKERRVEETVLADVGELCVRRSQETLAEAGQLAQELTQSSAEVRRMILGLDTIRILGRVESRRDPVFEAAFSATLDQIDLVQAEISDSLRNLSNQAFSIHATLTALQSARS